MNMDMDLSMVFRSVTRVSVPKPDRGNEWHYKPGIALSYH